METRQQIKRDILQDWKVLIVDDEADSLEVATRILRHYSADVYTASNGNEGLQAARSLVYRRFQLYGAGEPARLCGSQSVGAVRQVAVPIVVCVLHFLFDGLR